MSTASHDPSHSSLLYFIHFFIQTTDFTGVSTFIYFFTNQTPRLSTWFLHSKTSILVLLRKNRLGADETEEVNVMDDSDSQNSDFGSEDRDFERSYEKQGQDVENTKSTLSNIVGHTFNKRIGLENKMIEYPQSDYEKLSVTEDDKDEELPHVSTPGSDFCDSGDEEGHEGVVETDAEVPATNSSSSNNNNNDNETLTEQEKIKDREDEARSILKDMAVVSNIDASKHIPNVPEMITSVISLENPMSPIRNRTQDIATEPVNPIIEMVLEDAPPPVVVEENRETSDAESLEDMASKVNMRCFDIFKHKRTKMENFDKNTCIRRFNVINEHMEYFWAAIDIYVGIGGMINYRYRANKYQADKVYINNAFTTKRTMLGLPTTIIQTDLASSASVKGRGSVRYTDEITETILEYGKISETEYESMDPKKRPIKLYGELKIKFNSLVEGTLHKISTPVRIKTKEIPMEEDGNNDNTATAQKPKRIADAPVRATASQSQTESQSHSQHSTSTTPTSTSAKKRSREENEEDSEKRSRLHKLVREKLNEVRQPEDDDDEEEKQRPSPKKPTKKKNTSESKSKQREASPARPKQTHSKEEKRKEKNSSDAEETSDDEKERVLSLISSLYDKSSKSKRKQMIGSLKQIIKDAL